MMRKITSLFIIFCFSIITLQAQAAMDRLVSISFQNLSYPEALDKLSNKSGVDITFIASIFPNKKINAEFRNLSLEDILINILEGTYVRYRIVGRSIVLYRYEPEDYTISGYVVDAESGERLIGASIWTEEQRKGTFTNAYGFFSLALPEGQHDLSVSYLGYHKKEILIQLKRNTKLRIKLVTKIFLNEIEITSTEVLKSSIHGRGNTSGVIDIGEVDQMPSLGGETDIIRFLHSQPGVQTGADGVGGLFVRGGNPGHNLILIDDVPVYGLSHGAGLLSILNTDAIRSAEFIKGNVPARYGGRLSSVLDIRTKEGNLHNFHAQAEASLLTGKFYAEGPIIPGKASFFVSGRQSLVNLFLKPYLQGTVQSNNRLRNTSYDFHDYNVKLNYEIDSSNQVYFSLYSNNDDFNNSGTRSNIFTASSDEDERVEVFKFDRSFDESIAWGNTVAALRWNHIFSPKLFANTTLTYSRLWVDIGYTRRDSLFRIFPYQAIDRTATVNRFYSGIEDFGGKLDLELNASNTYQVYFGISYNHHMFTPGAFQLEESNDEIENRDVIFENEMRSREYVAYIENRFQFDNQLFIDLGLRASILGVSTRNYRVLQPRVNIQWQALPTLRLKGSYSETYQFVHLLSNSDFGLPTDLWVPSTRNIPPQEARQSVLGFEWQFQKGWLLNVEGFYNQMENLITYSDGVSYFSNWQRNVTRGRGTSRGIEAQVRKRWGVFSGWLSYTLSDTDRQFENVNQGEPFPFKYDRRHNLSLAMNYKFTRWLNMSVGWTISTGLAFSLPSSKYEFQFSELDSEPITALVFNGKNENRLPPYHRLDVGLNGTFKTGNLRHKIRLGIYNIYNRQNPLYYDLRTSVRSQNGVLTQYKEFVQFPLAPLIPSLSYAISF